MKYALRWFGRLSIIAFAAFVVWQFALVATGNPDTQQAAAMWLIVSFMVAVLAAIGALVVRIFR
jgi:hypothetical protein